LSAHPDVIVLTGPAGSGKSTLSWELGTQLADAGVEHVALDTDELDRAWPASLDQQAALCRANLASFWRAAAEQGHTRVVLSGVLPDLVSRDHWILDALPDARVRIVRLEIDDARLEERVRAREIGSGADAQLQRSLLQAAWFRRRELRGLPEHVVDAGERSLVSLAREVVAWSRWTRGASVAIRDYAPAHLDAARALWVELTERHRLIYDDPTIGGDEPGLAFDAYLALPQHLATWVAVVDGDIVGLTGLLADGDGGVVEPVVVTAAARGEGIGTRLLQHVRAEAARRGMRSLGIHPVARNVDAIRLFHRAGFRTLGHLDLFCDLVDRGYTWQPGVDLHGLAVEC
jgi:GNAT superfamily N-acetyltransferase